MPLFQDVHQQFASFFPSPGIRPLAYLLSKRLAEGHICLDLKGIQEEWEQLPANLAFSAFSKDRLLKETQVSGAGDPKQPFILHRDKLYIQRYFHYESKILERIRSMIASE